MNSILTGNVPFQWCWGPATTSKQSTVSWECLGLQPNLLGGLRREECLTSQNLNPGSGSTNTGSAEILDKTRTVYLWGAQVLRKLVSKMDNYNLLTLSGISCSHDNVWVMISHWGSNKAKNEKWSKAKKGAEIYILIHNSCGCINSSSVPFSALILFISATMK